MAAKEDLTFGERFRAIKTAAANGEQVDLEEARDLRSNLFSFFGARAIAGGSEGTRLSYEEDLPRAIEFLDSLLPDQPA